MANPVTGPFVTVSNSQVHTTDVKVSFKQAKPYNQPLPYARQVYTGSREDSSAVWMSGPDNTRYVDFAHVGPIKDASFGPQSMTEYTRYKDHTTNRAYERLKGKVSESAGWAETIAQASSAREMFNNRATQVWDIVRFLTGRGRNIPQGLIGGKTPKELNALAKAKKPSSTFLEVEYGWRPLMSDIKSSIEIMCSEPDIRYLSASSRSGWYEETVSNIQLGGGAYNSSKDTRKCEIRVRMGAGFVVTNANLFLATRLGIIDPALPWKLIPYSFVVDWFINVEQVASSITDWFGLSILQPYTTTTGKAFRKEVHSSAAQSLIVPGGYDTSSGTVDQVGVEVSRIMGLTAPTLTLRPFRGLSIERGLQAIALVITGLGGVSGSKPHFVR